MERQTDKQTYRKTEKDREQERATKDACDVEDSRVERKLLRWRPGKKTFSGPITYTEQDYQDHVSTGSRGLDVKSVETAPDCALWKC